MRLALYLFMFSINFEMFNLLGESGSFSIGRLIGFLYILSMILVRYRFDFSGLSSLIYIIMAFFLVVTFSGIINLNETSSKIIDASLFQNIVLFFLFLVHERKDPGVLEKSLYAFALGTACLSAFYLFGIGIEYVGGRLSIFGDNENAVGLRGAISSAFLIYFVFISGRKMSWKSAVNIAFIGGLLLMMLETGSRVAFIAFVLMVVILLVTYLFVDPVKRVLPSLLYSVLVMFFLVPFLLSNNLILERLWAVGEGDISGRNDIWISYIPAIWRSPLIGYGYSGFEHMSIGIFGEIMSPHNVIIEVLLYGGFVALVIFMIFNFKVILSALSMCSIEKKYLGAVLLIPYIGLLSAGQMLDKKIMWFVLAFNCISLVHDFSAKKNIAEHEQFLK